MSLAGVAMLIISEALAFPLAHIFVGYDEKLLEMTVHGFRVFSLMFPLASINIFASSFFTALNNGGVSAAISFLRTFVFKLAAVLILPLLFKLDGIWWATIVAELFAFLLSIGFVAAKRKNTVTDTVAARAVKPALHKKVLPGNSFPRSTFY